MANVIFCIYFLYNILLLLEFYFSAGVDVLESRIAVHMSMKRDETRLLLI